MPWTGDDDAARVLEDEVFSLVNAWRLTGANCGGAFFPSSAPLDVDEVLRGTSRDHSADMATRGYLDHVNPDGDGPSDRMSDAGFEGSFPWGENVAAGYPTAQEVVDGWMTSAGHCANILEPTYGVIGVGYFLAEGDAYGHYWTQNFAGSH